MIATVRHLTRLFDIARVLARYDALEALEVFNVARGVVWLARPFRRKAAKARLGVRLAQAATELGPTFIKLGQALSTRADLVGEQMANDLAQLRDRLPPFDGKDAVHVVETALDGPISSYFTDFDQTPVAAASIAQVHFAETTDGRPVAVKVLRPGVEKAFQRDLALLEWLAHWIERARPRWRRLRPVDSVRTFAAMVATEMDLRLEGAAASELAENFADIPAYRVPAVDWERTSQNVLTTERIHGTPLDDRDRIIADGHDPDRIMEIAAQAMFMQVFDHGFFHGDPHPGNLFVDSQGAVAVVDFGIMGRLDLSTRRYLAEMMMGFFSGDYEKVARVHFDAGFVPADQSIGAFTQACRSIAEPITGKPANEISVGRLLGQLFQITETFGMRTQPHLLLLQKVMVVAEGVGRSLNPEVNMWSLATPLIRDWMIANMGPDARIRDGAQAALDAARRLPDLVEKGERLLQKLDQGADLFIERSRRKQPNRTWLLLGAAIAAGAVIGAAIVRLV